MQLKSLTSIFCNSFITFWVFLVSLNLCVKRVKELNISVCLSLMFSDAT